MIYCVIGRSRCGVQQPIGKLRASGLPKAHGLRRVNRVYPVHCPKQASAAAGTPSIARHWSLDILSRTRNCQCCINCRRECNKSARPARERDRPGVDSPATRSLSALVAPTTSRPLGPGVAVAYSGWSAQRKRHPPTLKRTARRPGSQQPIKTFRVEPFQPTLPSQLLRPGTGRAPEPQHLRDDRQCRRSLIFS